jgi:iron complex transport system ATP-binding protein
MIRYDAVRVRYPRASADALAGVSLDIEPGRITAVAGPNGSGKSTLVRALLGRVPLAAGRITLGGVDVGAVDRRALARAVAVVTQREEPAFPVAVRDYVALGRFPHAGRWGGASAADAAAVHRAVDLTGVGPLLDRTTDQLSGGEWQRVRLARALAQEGRVFVLDEPTTFLDVAHEMELFERLASLAGAGQGVLLVSHELNLVARFAHTMVLLDRGSVAASGAPDVVMQGAVLERVYEWPLVVTRDPAVGAPALVPLRRPAPSPPQRHAR